MYIREVLLNPLLFSIIVLHFSFIAFSCGELAECGLFFIASKYVLPTASLPSIAFHMPNLKRVEIIALTIINGTPSDQI